MSDLVPSASPPYRQPDPPPADPPPRPVKGFSPYAIVVLVLATGVAAWLGRTALTLEPPPAAPESAPAH